MIKFRITSPVADVKIECPPEHAAEAVLHARDLLADILPVTERLGAANANFRWGEVSAPALNHLPVDDANEVATGAIEDSRSDAKPEKRRRSTSGGAKTANWQIIDLALTDEQVQSVKDVFAEKQPKGQNQEVAVLAWKLKELLGRDTFDGNEIHTALGIVDRPTPGNLAAVFNNMRAAKMCDVKEGKLVVNFLTDNFVKHKLPAKTAPSA